MNKHIKARYKKEIPEIFDDLAREKRVLWMQEREEELLESAWGIIANANGGNWDLETKEWKEAAEKWRDKYISNL